MLRIDGEAEVERGKEEARNVTMTMTMIGTETETETTVAEAGAVIERYWSKVLGFISLSYFPMFYRLNLHFNYLAFFVFF